MAAQKWIAADLPDLSGRTQSDEQAARGLWELSERLTGVTCEVPAGAAR